MSGRNRLYSSDSILTGGTSELNAYVESWMSHQNVNDNRGYIDDLHVNIGFYGFDLEGVHSHELKGGGEITPSILLGLRGYDWNGDNSYGLLLNGSADFTSPIGLSLDGSSYLEFSGFDHIQRRGLQENIEFDSGNDELVVLLSTTSSWMRSSTVPGRLLPDANFLSSEMEQRGQEDGFSLESEMGYGLNHLDGIGLLTPHFGVALDKNGVENRYIGSEFRSNDLELSINLEVKRNTDKPDLTDNEVSINGKVKW